MSEQCKYICVERFCIDKWDEECCPIEGEHIWIDKGSIWVAESITPNTIQLKSISSYGWMDINQEAFKAYFRRIECIDCKYFHSPGTDEGRCIQEKVQYKTAGSYPVCKNYVPKDEE